MVPGVTCFGTSLVGVHESVGSFLLLILSTGSDFIVLPSGHTYGVVPVDVVDDIGSGGLPFTRAPASAPACRSRAVMNHSMFLVLLVANLLVANGSGDSDSAEEEAKPAAGSCCSED